MKRFNASRVKASAHLTPEPEKMKAYRKRVIRHAEEAVKFATVDRAERADKSKPLPRKDDYKPCRVRGSNGTRLSPEVRALIARRNASRAEFFASV